MPRQSHRLTSLALPVMARAGFILNAAPIFTALPLLAP